LKASNAEAYDHFGYAVGISGDAIVVGANFEAGDSASTAASPNNNAAEAGAAYVFTRSGSTWTQQAYLKAFNADGADRFGTAVAISGDTVIVGANWEAGDETSTAASPNNDGHLAGAVYVYVRSGSTWTQQAYLKASNAGTGGDEFGTAVGISSDTIVVGAPERSGAAGAAYVFTRSGTTWTEQAYLEASNFADESVDNFGFSVAVYGDTIVVGAPYEDGDSASTAASPNVDATDAGAAYVHTQRVDVDAASLPEGVQCRS
jgi:uncharacterized membrane protein